MEIDRDRIAMIKNAHLRIFEEKSKPKVKIVPQPKPYLPPDKEAFRALKKRNYEAYRKNHREKGLCRKCTKEAIFLIYVHDGRILHSRKSQYCPEHLEGKTLKALLQGGQNGAASVNATLPPTLPDKLPT